MTTLEPRKVGKSILRYCLDVFPAALIFWILTAIFGAVITNVTGALGIWIVAVATFLLVTWAFAYHKNEERFYDLIPFLIFSGALVATISGFDIPIKTEAITTITEFAVAVSSFYISDELVLKIFPQLRD